MPTGAPLKGKVWRALWNQVRAEEDTCWLCGEPIDMNLKWPDPWSFSVDHVIPRKRAPHLTFERSNLRAAHLRHNLERQDTDIVPERASRRF